MRKILLTFFTLTMLFSTVSWGQIATFEFPATNSLVCSSKDASLSVSDISLSSGTIETNITTGTYFSNEPYIEETGGWTATSQVDAKCFTFTITANTGYIFSITNISFNSYATSAGPSAFSSEIDGTSIAVVNAPSATLVNYSQAVSKSGLSSAVIKIQGWSNGSRTTSGGGTFRLDDIVIDGTVSSSSTSSITLSTSAALTESSLNGAELTIDLTSETFVASLGISDFTLNNAPTGTSINGVTRNSDTQATLTLLYDLTDFDTDISDFSVTANSTAVTGGIPLTSNSKNIDAYASPDATTNSASSTLNCNATLNGTVTSNGYSTTVSFEYGPTVSYGTEVTADESPLAFDASSSSVSHQLSGLTNGQEYHYRVKTVNAEGTSYGSDQTFTPIIPPTLIISEIADPSDIYQCRFVEIYNYGASNVDLTADNINLAIQVNGGSYTSIALSGTLAAGASYVVANSSSYYPEIFGKSADQYSGSINGNGDDGYYLFANGNASSGILFDAYGIPNETGSVTWAYTDSKAVRKTTVSASNANWTATEWNIISAASSRTSPGTYPATVWNGSVDGNWTNSSNWDNGLASSSINAYIWEGATNFPQLTSSASVNNLVIQHNAQLNGQEYLTISGAVTINHQITESTNGSTLDHWQYFTSPFTGTTSGDLLSSNDRVDIYMVEYDNSLSETEENCWSFISSTSTNLATGKGFAVTFVNDETETGSTISGTDYNMALSGTLIDVSSSTSVSLTQGLNTCNLIGNPYLAPINWYDDTNLDFTNIQGNAAYIYDPNIANYITITNIEGGSGTSVPSGNGLIPPMQAFFVKAASNGSFTLDLNSRVNTGQTFYKSSSLISQMRLQLKSDDKTDETIIFLNENAVNSYDKLDADKLFANSLTPQIFTYSSDGKKLVFNHVNSLTEQINLDIITKYKGTYSLNLAELSGEFNDYKIELTTQNGATYNLGNNGYEFTSGEEIETHHFTLNFQNRTGINSNELEAIKAYTINSTIHIQSEMELNAKVNIFSLSGQKIYSCRINGYKKEINLDVDKGIVILQLIEGSQVLNYKLNIN